MILRIRPGKSIIGHIEKATKAAFSWCRKLGWRQRQESQINFLNTNHAFSCGKSTTIRIFMPFQLRWRWRLACVAVQNFLHNILAVF